MIEPAWWRHGVIYQIYPRSFQDSNGDGIGDLAGVLERLDYLNDGTLRSLGIDAIWFSPTFPSPMADFGYDISDYCGVHPDFGNLAAMDRVIAACHHRGIRVLLDFVPNHTSSQHPWFLESRASRESALRDWYVWRDPAADGGPPNNWVAAFGGPAWEFDATTGQYYLHSFLVEQPDLNWRNPAVVETMHAVLRFWLDRGVDGFRIDVMGAVLKDPLLRDNPPNPDPTLAALEGERASQLHVYDINWPDVFGAVRGIRRVLDEYPQRMAVGEVFGPPDVLGQYYGGEALDGLQLAFNFSAMVESGVYGAASTWSAERFRRVIDDFEAGLPAGAWPNLVLGNHDVSRLISRHDQDGYGRVRARVAAMLLLTVRGTPFMYYGDEIGMVDVTIPADRLRDPARFHGRGRDPERTPMQWTAEAGAGFTSGEPWLPLGDPRINGAEQDSDPASLLNLYRRLIWFRKGSPALRFGTYRALDGVPEDVFAYLREDSSERLLVALNFGLQPRRLLIPPDFAQRLISTDPTRSGMPVAGGALDLLPNEGAIVGRTA